MAVLVWLLGSGQPNVSWGWVFETCFSNAVRFSVLMYLSPCFLTSLLDLIAGSAMRAADIAMHRV